MPVTNCRYFSGYKPCGHHDQCDVTCPHKDIPTQYLLIVHLEALGAVLRTTSILPAIRRRFPKAHITWVTQAPADKLLQGNPLVDRILTTSPGDLLSLSALNFDVGLCLDKSLKAMGVIKQTHCDLVLGFCADPKTGAILPANPEAEELWSLGLSNQKKFFENAKAETELMVDALGLGPFQRDEYVLHLSPEEQELAELRRREWGRGRKIVGINTGCSAVIPYKKLSYREHRKLIEKMRERLDASLVLLGGPEDTAVNQRLHQDLGVISSPTELGLRDGLVSVQACDVVVTGDSLGMHMAIALRKWVVAWFGPTCAHEIDLYDRGVKILSSAACSPCWKRSCEKTPMCYELVDLDEVVRAIATQIPRPRPQTSLG